MSTQTRYEIWYRLDHPRVDYWAQFGPSLEQGILADTFDSEEEAVTTWQQWMAETGDPVKEVTEEFHNCGRVFQIVDDVDSEIYYFVRVTPKELPA